MTDTQHSAEYILALSGIGASQLHLICMSARKARVREVVWFSILLSVRLLMDMLLAGNDHLYKHALCVFLCAELIFMNRCFALLSKCEHASSMPLRIVQVMMVSCDVSVLASILLRGGGHGA